MTKIIQSGLFHGFHLLLIASPALLEVSRHIVEPSKGTADYFSVMTPIPDGISGRRHLYIPHTSRSHYPRPCTAAVQHVKYSHCTTLSPFSTTWRMLAGVLSVRLFLFDRAGGSFLVCYLWILAQFLGPEDGLDDRLVCCSCVTQFCGPLFEPCITAQSLVVKTFPERLKDALE